MIQTTKSIEANDVSDAIRELAENVDPFNPIVPEGLSIDDLFIHHANKHVLLGLTSPVEVYTFNPEYPEYHRHRSFVRSGQVFGLNLPEQQMLMEQLSRKYGIEFRLGTVQEYFGLMSSNVGRNVFSRFNAYSVVNTNILARVVDRWSGRYKFEIRGVEGFDLDPNATVSGDHIRTDHGVYKVGNVLTKEVPTDPRYFYPLKMKGSTGSETELYHHFCRDFYENGSFSEEPEFDSNGLSNFIFYRGTLRMGLPTKIFFSIPVAWTDAIIKRAT